MKQLICLLLTMSLLAGCKKDSSKQKELLLSSLSTDGAVTARFQYDGNNNLTRYELYSSGVLSAYIQVGYDGNGFINLLSTFSMPGEIPIARYQITTDAKGKTTSVTSYSLQGPTPNVPDFISTYTYNANGQVSKVAAKDIDGKLVNSTSLLYYPDGSVKETQIYKEENNLLWLWQKSVYANAGDFPKGVNRLEPALGPQVTANYFSESIHDYVYDKDGTELTHKSRLMSGREFNTDGTLKQQTETYNFIKPIKPKEVNNKGFGYVFQ